MKKNWKLRVGAVLAVLLVACLAAVVSVFAGETKYDTGTVSAEICFGAQAGQRTIKAIEAFSDKTGASLLYFARPSTVSKYAVTTPYAASGGTNVYFANTSITGGDICVYQHASGRASWFRAGTIVSMTNTTFIEGSLGEAGTNGDYVYEVQLAGGVFYGYVSQAAASNVPYSAQGELFKVPGDSPVVCIATGDAAVKLLVTSE